jgi:hypothetical protein
MPASTVNALSASQLASLTVNQIVALQQSPYYSYFSSFIKNALTSSLNGGSISPIVSSLSIIKLDLLNLIVLLCLSLAVLKFK